MLPFLHWFRGSARDAAVFAAVHDAEGGSELGSIFALPPPSAWMADSRQGVVVDDRSVFMKRAGLEWEIPRADLDIMVREATAGRGGPAFSPSWYWGGGFRQIRLDVSGGGLHLEVSSCSGLGGRLQCPPALLASCSVLHQQREWALKGWFLEEGVGMWQSFNLVQFLARHGRGGKFVVEANITCIH